MNSLWAVHPAVLEQYKNFEKTAISQVSSADIEKFETKLAQIDDENLTIVDSTAIIKIEGVLTNRPSMCDFLFNRSINTYPRIIRQLQAANDQERVKQVELRVNSPGGVLNGLFDLLDVIKSNTKPIEAVVFGMADSAAYGIVSQADKIIANGSTSEVGNIGVARRFFISDDEVTIASTDAPNKRPDVKTNEGAAIVRAELDEIHQEFVKIIAEGRTAATGRQFTEAIVNSDFGRGGTMLADAGLLAGMIDEIKPSPERVSNSRFFQNSGPASQGLGSVKTQKNKKMDLNQLKQEHPQVYADAVAAGVAQERERVQALVETGRACGKIDYAIECVANGKCITQPTVSAAFLAAQINNRDQDNRGSDDPPPVNPPEANASADDESAGDNHDALADKYVKNRKKRRTVNA
jgi:ClpP class serine protease